jgi:hypothetical protein
MRLGMVAHTSNPSYLGGEDGEDHSQDKKAREATS